MSYFWVNQGGTYQDEIQGNCLWAPEYNKNGNSLNHWDSMLLLKPGDIVFNYSNGKIRGYAVVQSSAVPMQRPYNSGNPYALAQGGRFVFCKYEQLPPKQSILRDTLIENAVILSELSSGDNPVFTKKQTVSEKYLCPISETAGTLLMNLLTKNGLPNAKTDKQSAIISKTTTQQLVEARIGQGKFRSDLLSIFNGACPITGLTKTELLRASHILPWSKSNNIERLDPDNGLLLAAGIDAAFDKGLISFDINGSLLTKLSTSEMDAIGLPHNAKLPTRALTSNRVKYLNSHRAVSKL